MRDGNQIRFRFRDRVSRIGTKTDINIPRDPSFLRGKRRFCSHVRAFFRVLASRPFFFFEKFTSPPPDPFQFLIHFVCLFVYLLRAALFVIFVVSFLPSDLPLSTSADSRKGQAGKGGREMDFPGER